MSWIGVLGPEGFPKQLFKAQDFSVSQCCIVWSDLSNANGMFGQINLDLSYMSMHRGQSTLFKKGIDDNVTFLASEESAAMPLITLAAMKASNCLECPQQCSVGVKAQG